MTDFRTLCAELADAYLRLLEHINNSTRLGYEPSDDPLLLRVRAALAEPADGPAAGAEGPSDEELLATINKATANFPPSHPQAQPLDVLEYQLALELCKARAVLARWGQPPAPPAEGEVAELVAWLHGQDGGLGRRAIYARAAELLERHAAMENLAADAVSGLRYIEQSAGRLYGVGWDRVFDAAATLQPAHALPLPALQDGEVEP